MPTEKETRFEPCSNGRTLANSQSSVEILAKRLFSVYGLPNWKLTQTKKHWKGLARHILEAIEKAKEKIPDELYSDERAAYILACDKIEELLAGASADCVGGVAERSCELAKPPAADKASVGNFSGIPKRERKKTLLSLRRKCAHFAKRQNSVAKIIQEKWGVKPCGAGR